MPAKSQAQQKFMGRCISKGGKDCPPKKVAREFAKINRAKRLPKRANRKRGV